MNAGSRFGRAALAYATRLGFCVFPLRAQRKEPEGRLCPRGFRDASLDVQAIGSWWAAAPSANVGVACAASGLLVIDVDPRNRGDDTFAALARELGDLPRSWTVLTPGGGAHYYLRYGGPVPPGGLGPGIDLKHRGYIVAPPSLHPNGGTYRWDLGAHPLESPIAALPEAWRARMFCSPTRRDVTVGADARASFLGAAFEAVGRLGRAMPDGRRLACCPWLAEHTDGRGNGTDSSTILFPPAAGAEIGSFFCSHAHCASRSLTDVVRALPPIAIDRASRLFPRAYRNLLRRLAVSRARAP